MRTQQDDLPVGPASPGGLRLAPAAAELYRDLQLSEVLRHLLIQSGRLLDALAGSVSFVDAAFGSYSKVAERGASCRVGETFPLEHGVTGQVAARRRPVVLRRYSDVPVGHVPAAHPAHRGTVVAVPIWWRGEVIGANVAFAGRQREVPTREVDQLEVLSQVAAAGIVVSTSTGTATGPVPAAAADPGWAPGGGVGPDRLPVGPPLTPREREVLALLARGLTDRQVAAVLVLSAKTVEKHVGAVLRKTGTSSRTAAVVLALEHGWLPVPGRVEHS